MHIGVIGLGNIGGQVATNLVTDGHEVTVFDTDEARVTALVESGARAVSGPSSRYRRPRRSTRLPTLGSRALRGETSWSTSPPTHRRPFGDSARASPPGAASCSTRR